MKVLTHDDAEFLRNVANALIVLGTGFSIAGNPEHFNEFKNTAERLQAISAEALANFNGNVAVPESKTDPSREALKPFAALLQPHNDDGPDSKPIFAINDAMITLGDLRRARDLTKDE